jgi:hypothetical protein
MYFSALERDDLSRLEDRQLEDIGLVRVRHTELSASYFPIDGSSTPAAEVRGSFLARLWDAVAGAPPKTAVPNPQHPLTPALKAT